MTVEQMQIRIEQLEATVARLQTHARNADGHDAGAAPSGVRQDRDAAAGRARTPCAGARGIAGLRRDGRPTHDG
jgi:hypothetical protein